MESIVKKLFKTMIYTLIWCHIWIALEIILYGHAENREVDNIMTFIVIPIIYRAVN
nr:MAG TPA: hypothetical protein [Caudoviricetes sp.]